MELVDVGTIPPWKPSKEYCGRQKAAICRAISHYKIA